MAEDRITPGDLDATLELFRGRVYRASIQRAIKEVGSWQHRLQATGDPGLASIADDLGALKALLEAEYLDADAIGRLLGELGEQTVKVGGRAVPAAVDEKLQRLGGLLEADGRMLRVLFARKDRTSSGERARPGRGSRRQETSR